VLFWKNLGSWYNIPGWATRLFHDHFMIQLKSMARDFFTLRYITLPLPKPSFLFVIVMIASWDLPQTALPYQMTKGGSEYSTTTLMLYIYLQSFQA